MRGLVGIMLLLVSGLLFCSGRAEQPFEGPVVGYHLEVESGVAGYTVTEFRQSPNGLTWTKKWHIVE